MLFITRNAFRQLEHEKYRLAVEEELDEEYFETQVAYEQSVTKMEVEDIMKMECDLFDEMIK